MFYKTLIFYKAKSAHCTDQHSHNKFFWYTREKMAFNFVPWISKDEMLDYCFPITAKFMALFACSAWIFMYAGPVL